MMKSIPEKVSSFVRSTKNLTELSVDEIRSGIAPEVKTYTQLISNIAQLAFANPELLLLMRGQSTEYKENKQTTLFPSMYRKPANGGDSFYGYQLRERYDKLQRCEKSLFHTLQNTVYGDSVGRSELARWAILQHYEICPTPLLDVTHSVQVACSFAFLDKKNLSNFCYLYVLGVPQINGSVTVSPNQGIQVVRLSSVCPPETLRPYFQEGYLLGNYPSVDTLDDKMRYSRSEMDCARRLVAKFKIPRSDSFWDMGFHCLPGSAMYPEENGSLCESISQLKENS